MAREGAVEGFGDVRAPDLRALHGVVEAGYEDDPGPVLPWEFLEGVARLVPSERGASFQELSYVEERMLLYQDAGAGREADLDVQDDADDDRPFWDAYWRSGCSYPQRTGDQRSILLDTDRRTFPAGAKDPVFEEYLIPNGVFHGAVVSLPAPPGQTRRLLIHRGRGPAFTERDRQVLSMLRPHLQEVFCDAARRRAGVPRLSEREWQVLSLAGVGLGNAQIAAALVISQHTVRKHMEHVMERLGVHSRAAAVAAALPHRPVGVAVPGTPGRQPVTGTGRRSPSAPGPAGRPGPRRG